MSILFILSVDITEDKKRFVIHIRINHLIMYRRVIQFTWIDYIRLHLRIKTIIILDCRLEWSDWAITWTCFGPPTCGLWIYCDCYDQFQPRLLGAQRKIVHLDLNKRWWDNMLRFCYVKWMLLSIVVRTLQLKLNHLREAQAMLGGYCGSSKGGRTSHSNSSIYIPPPSPWAVVESNKSMRHESRIRRGLEKM